MTEVSVEFNTAYSLMLDKGNRRLKDCRNSGDEEVLSMVELINYSGKFK